VSVVPPHDRVHHSLRFDAVAVRPLARTVDERATRIVMLTSTEVYV
jgi:hypothetical protein